uniref:Uncharacterized protein n=1 Tax=Anguilla anguilla TaxID=7936 RepID=A0A0E9SDE0_ANGAN
MIVCIACNPWLGIHCVISLYFWFASLLVHLSILSLALPVRCSVAWERCHGDH